MSVLMRFQATRARWVRALALSAGLSLVVAVITSCGNGNLPGAKKPTPQAWAKDICGAVALFGDKAEKVNEAFDDVDKDADPAKIKSDVDKLLADTEKLADKAIDKVEDAGTPDTKNGEPAAKAFRQLLVDSKDAMTKARKSVRSLDASDRSAFFDKFDEIGKQFKKDAQAHTKDFQDIDSPELDKAFDKEPACNTD